MKSKISVEATNTIAILLALVSLFIFSACGSRAGSNVDNIAAASQSPPDRGKPIATNNPSPTASSAKAIDKSTQEDANLTRNNKSALVSSGPKPQIGTGGDDLFQFTQARAAINSDPELKTANIVIDVKSSVLTLSGAVASAAQKSKAEQLVRAVGGVKEVKNRLRISS